jgi:hypothetical protein
MKTSRPRRPLALLSICALALASCLTAGLVFVEHGQNNEPGSLNGVAGQIALTGIEGEELPVPFA